MPAPAFKPYAEDAASLGIGELTLENGTECVVVYGPQPTFVTPAAK